nr:phage tail tube protein [Ralstonia sp. ASV6]
MADKPGTFTPSGTKREHKPGRLAQDGGFTASSMPAKLELSLNLTPGLDIDAINAIENEDVTVRMADGSVYLLSQAFTSEPVAMDDGTSKVTILANTSERIS